MSYQLNPTTAAGEKFVTAAESITQKLRERSSDADKAATVERNNFDDMHRAGINSAFIPTECGGFGLTSIHDWMAGMTRLGRADGSSAIAMNMHVAVSRGMAMGWHAAKAGGNETSATQIEQQFEQIVSGDMYICATATEPGTDNLHPMTEAVAADGGWKINGLKIFVTGSPIASHLAMNLRIPEQDAIGSVMLPMTTPGIEPQNDWQAMGMRASGSQSIVFKDVFVPSFMVRPMAPWGRWSVNLLMNRNLANLPLLGVFVGIAEYALELAVDATTGSKPRPGKPARAEQSSIQHMIGEMEINLATAQALLGKMGQLADAFVAEHPDGKISFERAHELLKDHQSMKWVVNRNAIEVVNRAMDVVGGSAFMDKHPLSQLYRDVRAGPFMQPYSPSEAREYIGKVMLGIYPED